MDVCVARQAILNRHKDLYAYELLFRSNPEQNQFDGTESSSATGQVIANTLFSAGLEGILGGKRAFINFDRKMLLEGAFSILPKETVVIEILESVEPDDQVVSACARLGEAGYTIALDDFVHHPKFEPLIERAHILKLDMLATSRSEQERLVAKYGRQGIRMLAEKVETLQQFEWALGIGFDYFQGYFFNKPVVVKGRQITASKLSCLRMLQEARHSEIDFDKVRALIKDDVSFSFKLLRFTNSALFPHYGEIHTIEQALIVMGEHGIRLWVAIAALPVLAGDKPNELLVQSLLRAQFGEKLARLAGYAPPSDCFMLGLFSLLDALLDRTMEYALQQIKLASPVEEALLGLASPDNKLAAIYSLIRSYEASDWDNLARLADELGVPPSKIGEAYMESALWVSEVNALT